MQEDTELAKLLRSRREERPSDEYFESFLHDFRRRQREDLLQIPVWRLALERFSGLISQLEVPRYAYASAFSVFLLVVVSIGYFPTGSNELLPIGEGSGNGAVNIASAGNANAGSYRPASRLMLDGRLAPASFDTGITDGGVAPAMVSTAFLPTRYVLDTRPVSHASPFSF